MLTRNTAKLKQTVQQHLDMDALRQGKYWNEDNQKGCFIGCLTHSNNPLPAQKKYGLPIMLQRICESIFEGLDKKGSTQLFADFPDAVECDGKDLTLASWKFLELELKALPLQTAKTQAIIDPVIKGMGLIANGEKWDNAYAARAAARAAYAIDAADAAANATTYAADAADAAANARKRQAETILRLIKEA